jgi:hypothetical protein
VNTSLRTTLSDITLVVCALLGSPGAQSPLTAVSAGAAGERVDFDAVYKIKAEGLEQSQVMDTFWYLTGLDIPIGTSE